MNECDDHQMENLECANCNGYMGQICVHCGKWYDGGDHMAGSDIWCKCEAPMEPFWCQWCGGLFPYYEHDCIADEMVP